MLSVFREQMRTGTVMEAGLNLKARKHAYVMSINFDWLSFNKVQLKAVPSFKE